MLRMDRQALRRSIGRTLLVGIPAPEIDAPTRDILTRLEVGGVILFRRNVGEVKPLAALTAELRGLPSQPLVAIDHEGGRVLRVGAPFTTFPAMATVGATGDAEIAEQVGYAMGRELAAVGIDLNFAPVLDVHSNPANPVIGDRAFSDAPSVVATMGVAFMRGLQAGGVLACGKHFPGHGDTEVDSHLALPTVRRDRSELDRVELPPFCAAIAAGIPLIMTAHVCYPALDPQRPATLSPPILRALLREQLDFRGVVVSDDLEMRAISGHHDIGVAAVATIAAGVDLLSICADLRNAERAAEAIERAVIDKQLDLAVLEAAADRLRALKRPVARDRLTPADLPVAAHAALNQRLRDAPPALKKGGSRGISG
ncbi:MAG TPA: beta-N-acetylhexosaminidase [Candidatus Binatia bacterium]|nr:beta-N-acetylhexosaminidase [Candidatus Binatia bacterium]